MNRGEFQTSPVQQMIWGTGGGSNSTSSVNITSSLKPCPKDQEASPNLPSLSSPSVLFSQQFPHTSSGLAHMNGTGSLPTLHDGTGQENHMPESWSQLLLRGLVGDHERFSATAAILSKGLENWGDQAAASACMASMKEDGSDLTQAGYNFYGSNLHGDHEMPTTGGTKSQLSQMLLTSSPRSCITTSLGSNVLDFSNNAPTEMRSNHHHHSDNSSECNSTATGSAAKKARVQASSSAQSTLKVRKERLGGRITALHQIVSPFGKVNRTGTLLLNYKPPQILRSKIL